MTTRVGSVSFMRRRVPRAVKMLALLYGMCERVRRMTTRVGSVSFMRRRVPRTVKMLAFVVWDV
jgi:hypothetical protein